MLRLLLGFTLFHESCCCIPSLFTDRRSCCFLPSHVLTSLLRETAALPLSLSCVSAIKHDYNSVVIFS